MTSRGIWLTVKDAASVAGVSIGTIRNWIRDGLISYEHSEGGYQIDAAAFRVAKVFRRKRLVACEELLAQGIDEHDLARAIDAGAVVPSPGVARLFSLADRVVLAEFKQGNWVAPELDVAAEPVEAPKPEEVPESDDSTTLATAPKPAESTTPAVLPETAEPTALADPEPITNGAPDDFEQRLGRWPALRAYIVDHEDPARLPDHFWETRLCPEFVPPAGIFRFTYGQLLRFSEDKMFAGIRRSEGWMVHRRGLRFLPEEDGIEFVLGDGWTPGAEPPRYRARNMRWKSLRIEWRQAWFHRRRQLVARGVDVANLPDAEPADGRNRRTILRRYREEHWSPSDLPDWFWDTEAPPPFEPPTWVARYEYGKHAVDPKGSGEPGTWIRWTGMWQHPMGDPPFLDPANEHLEWVPGEFEVGSTPAQFEEENHEYALALMEWDAAYQRVQHLLHGEE